MSGNDGNREPDGAARAESGLTNDATSHTQTPPNTATSATLDVENLIGLRTAATGVIEHAMCTMVTLRRAADPASKTVGAPQPLPMPGMHPLSAHNFDGTVCTDISLPNGKGFRVCVTAEVADRVLLSARLLRELAKIQRIPRDAVVGRTSDDYVYAILDVPGLLDDEKKTTKVIVSLKLPGCHA